MKQDDGQGQVGGGELRPFGNDLTDVLKRLQVMAFTGLDALARWDRSARPVPVTSHQVAAAALEEGADGLLVDIAGPVRFAIDGDLLRDLARGLSPMA